jgi:hypothetical protein
VWPGSACDQAGSAAVLVSRASSLHTALGVDHPQQQREGTPFARLKVAQLALKVEAQRLALDESKGRLLDVATANATIDEIASTMRDALLNWPARVAGVIAAELGVEPHLLQTILQQYINELLTEASDRFDPPGIGGERGPHV